MIEREIRQKNGRDIPESLQTNQKEMYGRGEREMYGREMIDQDKKEI